MLAATTTVMLTAACAAPADGDNAATERTTTTERATTTEAPTTTATTTSPDDDAPSEGDLEVCALASPLAAQWLPEAGGDLSGLQDAVYAVLDLAHRADDAQLVTALDQLGTAVDSLDAEAAIAAITAYFDRCAGLGVPLF